MVPLLQISQREQALVQVPPIQQVNPTPLDDIEIHDIHNDMEEEEGTSSFLVSVLTSMISSIPALQQFDTMLDSSFSQQYLSKIKFSPILKATTSIPKTLVDSLIHTSSPPHSSPHPIPTSPLSQLPHINIPTISTTLSFKVDTLTPNYSSSLTIPSLTSPVNIPPLNT